eukprot:Awhi_evm1s416
MSSESTQNLNGEETFPNEDHFDAPGLGVAPLSKGLISWSDHRYTWRNKLLHFLHNKWVHYFLMFLLFLDVILVIAGIAVEIEFLDTEIHDLELLLEELIENPDEAATIEEEISEVGNLRLEEAEEGLAYASLAILFVFLLENILLMIGLGHRFFLSFFHVFDFGIVVASIVLEFILQDSPEGGLLILARTWRFARIAHGFYENTHNKDQLAIKRTCKKNKLPLSLIEDKLKNSTDDAEMKSKMKECVEMEGELISTLFLQV